MAAKKPKGQATIQWVDISLSQSEGSQMRNKYKEGNTLWDDLERLLDSGYKITLSRDDYNECFACYVIPKGDEHVNAGRILTARGNDWTKALRGALYRHYTLFSGDAWTDHGKQVVDAD